VIMSSQLRLLWEFSSHMQLTTNKATYPELSKTNLSKRSDWIGWRPQPSSTGTAVLKQAQKNFHRLQLLISNWQHTVRRSHHQLVLHI
jgi:hypothetical protein